MKKVLSAIGNAFKKVWKKVFSSDVIVELPSEMAITPELIDHCINTVNLVKNVINNPVVVLVTDLTPIQLDNDIRLKIAEALPVILAGLTYEKEALANVADCNDLVNHLLNKVRLSDDPEKDALYHTLCARLIMIVSDGEVTWSEAVGIVELYLKQIFGVPAAIIPDMPAPVAAPVVTVPAAVVLPPLSAEQIAAVVEANSKTAAPEVVTQ